MIFYETRIEYKVAATDTDGRKHIIPQEEADEGRKALERTLQDMNKALGTGCDEDNRISVYITDGGYFYLDALIAHPVNKITIEDCFEFIKEYLESNFAVENVFFPELKEISAKRFDFIGEKADDNGYIRRWHCARSTLGIDYHSNNTFKVEEYMEEKEYATLDEARAAAGEIMGDVSFLEELERIYSDENAKKYYGNPVHYRICASGMKSALDIIDVIVSSLIANKRLCGTRIHKVYDINESCYDETEFEHLFDSAQGNAVIIDMSGTDDDHGSYASAYNRVINYISDVVGEYQLNTLCFFVENREHPGFADTMMAKIAEDIRFITVNEGYGTREQAAAYLKKIVESDDFEITEDDIDKALDDRKMYSVGDIYEIYRKWFKNGLRTHIYKAYSHCECEAGLKNDKTSRPYDELQKMIGLTEVKQVVDDIIDSARIRKMRSSMGLDSYKNSLHMVFTGNPGSAKTTVARLIAQILRREDILESGRFVECGRADLIARYVGWTAKQVRSKFREAKGGILFIDEAYSLVDDSHSFADEAINTIVQEMENHREDVIVIFAGYPDKMKEFLNKNEGLRSRIAFHLDFPDYTPDEMLKILMLMAKERGYRLDEGVTDRCMEIFEKACLEDDFGNGRYARNLLEQAEMAQARRLSSEYRNKKIGKKAIQMLKTEDFDVNASRKTESMKKPIGFAV